MIFCGLWAIVALDGLFKSLVPIGLTWQRREPVRDEYAELRGTD